MYKLLLVPAVFLALASCQPGPKQNGNADSTNAPSATELPATWAKRFKGSLAGQNITLLLQKAGKDDIRGWYVYDTHGEPISLQPFFGETRADDSVIVNEGYTETDGVFRGTVSADGHFKGKWVNAKNSFDFDLAENNDSAVLFSVVSYADSARLLPDNPASPAATASAYTVWPAGGGESVVAFLQKALGPGVPQGATPLSLLKNGVDSFFAGYKSNAKDFDSTWVNSPSWNWSTQSGSVVAWNQWPLLAIEEWGYEFTGGAHGNGGSNFSAYDLAKQKKLTLADVFKPNYKPVVSAALDKSYLKKYKVASIADAGLSVKKIEPNSNFFLTSHGIVFSYTPYEIAAYAAGQITLFVPWEDIKTVVQEGYAR